MAKGILQTPLSAVIRAIIIVHRPLKALPARTEITGLPLEIIGTETMGTILEATDKHDCQNQRSNAGGARGILGWLRSPCGLPVLVAQCGRRKQQSDSSSAEHERACMN